MGSLLDGLPPLLVYVVVAAIILTESMGVPLPGEITLVSAALLASAHTVDVWGVAVAASVGAVVGDSIGYYIGHRGGRPLLERFGRRFPRHFGPEHLARAERTFARWGVWAVFFGRFVALLRILAGPLAGALRVPYRKFLLANAAGGVIWATGTTLVIYYLGVVAEHWLREFSWVALVVAVAFGIATTLWLRRRAMRAAEEGADAPPVDAVAAIAVQAARDSVADARERLHHRDPGSRTGRGGQRPRRAAPRARPRNPRRPQ